MPVFFFITEDSYGFFKVACLNFSDEHYTLLSKGPELDRASCLIALLEKKKKFQKMVLFASWVISVGCTFSIFY